MEKVWQKTIGHSPSVQVIFLSEAFQIFCSGLYHQKIFAFLKEPRRKFSVQNIASTFGEFTLSYFRAENGDLSPSFLQDHVSLGQPSIWVSA